MCEQFNQLHHLRSGEWHDLLRRRRREQRRWHRNRVGSSDQYGGWQADSPTFGDRESHPQWRHCGLAGTQQRRWAPNHRLHRACLHLDITDGSVGSFLHDYRALVHHQRTGLVDDLLHRGSGDELLRHRTRHEPRDRDVRHRANGSALGPGDTRERFRDRVVEHAVVEWWQRGHAICGTRLSCAGGRRSDRQLRAAHPQRGEVRTGAAAERGDLLHRRHRHQRASRGGRFDSQTAHRSGHRPDHSAHGHGSPHRAECACPVDGPGGGRRPADRVVCGDRLPVTCGNNQRRKLHHGRRPVRHREADGCPGLRIRHCPHRGRRQPGIDTPHQGAPRRRGRPADGCRGLCADAGNRRELAAATVGWRCARHVVSGVGVHDADRRNRHLDMHSAGDSHECGSGCFGINRESRVLDPWAGAGGHLLPRSGRADRLRPHLDPDAHRGARAAGQGAAGARRPGFPRRPPHQGDLAAAGVRRRPADHPVSRAGLVQIG